MSKPQFRLYGTRHAGLAPVTLTFQTRATDPDTGDETVTPIDLTGHTFTALVRQYPDEDSLQIAELDLTVSPTDGIVIVALREEVAADVPVGGWWWDLRDEPPGGSSAWYPFAPSPFVWSAVVTTP